MEQRLSAIEKELNDIKMLLTDGFTKTNSNFAVVHSKIDSLGGDTEKNFKKVEFHLETIATEISKINIATGYEDMIGNSDLIR